MPLINANGTQLFYDLTGLETAQTVVALIGFRGGEPGTGK